MPTRLKKRYSILLSDVIAGRFEGVARRRNGATRAREAALPGLRGPDRPPHRLGSPPLSDVMESIAENDPDLFAVPPDDERLDPRRAGAGASPDDPNKPNGHGDVGTPSEKDSD